MTSTCYTCGTRLPEETWCHVETHGEYLNRVGRHRGQCWNGNFPKSSDLPKLTDEEKETARERGANRVHHQLSLTDIAA